MVEAVYWILMTIGYYRIIGCDRVIWREISPLVSRCFHQSIHGRLAPGTLTPALQGGSIKADHAEKTHENTWNAENENVDSGLRFYTPKQHIWYEWMGFATGYRVNTSHIFPHDDQRPCRCGNMSFGSRLPSMLHFKLPRYCRLQLSPDILAEKRQ